MTKCWIHPRVHEQSMSYHLCTILSHSLSQRSRHTHTHTHKSWGRRESSVDDKKLWTNKNNKFYKLGVSEK